jgi:hypothetical protein
MSNPSPPVVYDFGGFPNELRERQEGTDMLERKWIIDNRGRLVGTWNDCRECDAAMSHFHQEPVLATARAVRSNDRAAG